MNFKDGEIVTYRGLELVFRIIKNKYTGEDIYFLYTKDGKIFTSNFFLNELNANLNNANITTLSNSFGESHSSGSGSSGGYSSSRSAFDKEQYQKSKKLSEDIGSLYETSKTLEDCNTLINEAKTAISTNKLTINNWNDAKNSSGFATEASIAFLSGITDSFDEVYKNLESTSKAAKALDDLNKNLKVVLVKYVEKFEKEKTLSEKENELSNTPKEIEDGVDANGNVKYKTNPRIAELESEISKIKEEIEKLNKDIDTLQNIIDVKYKEIKSKYSELKNLGTKENGINIDISDTIFGTSGKVDEKYSFLIKDVGDKLMTVSYDGDDFYLLNTPISVEDYVEYVKENNLYQNKGFMGSQCMTIALNYAHDMTTGVYTNGDNYSNSGVHSTMDRIVSQDKDDILEYTYEQVSQGNPVALQVTRKAGGRHFVTVVGFDKSVTSPSDLTPENLLVLDCVDGDVQRLSDRGRTIYNTGSGYQACAFPNQAVA